MESITSVLVLRTNYGRIRPREQQTGGSCSHQAGGNASLNHSDSRGDVRGDRILDIFGLSKIEPWFYFKFGFMSSGDFDSSFGFSCVMIAINSLLLLRCLAGHLPAPALPLSPSSTPHDSHSHMLSLCQKQPYCFSFRSFHCNSESRDNKY